jgi:hypothetical protein
MISAGTGVGTVITVGSDCETVWSSSEPPLDCEADSVAWDSASEDDEGKGNEDKPQADIKKKMVTVNRIVRSWDKVAS